jgi:hypothetical protein
MVPDIVGELTFFLNPRFVLIILVVLLITDFLNIFSDFGESFDSIFRIVIYLIAGYIVFSMVSPFI